MSSQRSWATLISVLLVTVIFALQVFNYIGNGDSSSDDHSRQKRFIFFTTERRLSLPPNTTLLVQSLLNLPAIRNLPLAYAADMTLSTDFSISFADLGLTSEENPWFMVPYITVTDETEKKLPGVNYAGGDRLLMFQVVEDMLESIGLEGKPCLLRAICEIFEVPFRNHGIIGEMLELFLSVSRSPYAEKRLEEYITAERTGKTTGDCSPYHGACSHSLFTNTTKQPKLIPVSEESRQKRFVYLTPERRLTLPPHTQFLFIPLINFPIRGNIPDMISGPSFQLQVSFVVNFDDLGLTTEEHPFGIVPGLDGFTRRKRETLTRHSDPKIPGGDRDFFYQIVEDTLHNIGLNGKACLLRAICEMFQYPLDNHGFFGEFLELLFSASLSPEADKRLPEYTAAERAGKTTGKCCVYHKACPYSFFTNPLEADTMNDSETVDDTNNQPTYETHQRYSLFTFSKMLGVLFQYFESWL